MSFNLNDIDFIIGLTEVSGLLYSNGNQTSEILTYVNIYMIDGNSIILSSKNWTLEIEMIIHEYKYSWRKLEYGVLDMNIG